MKQLYHLLDVRVCDCIL